MSQFMQNTDSHSKSIPKETADQNNHFLQCLQWCDYKQQANNDKQLADLVKKDAHKIKYQNKNSTEQKFIQKPTQITDYSHVLCTNCTMEPSSTHHIKTKRSLHQHNSDSFHQAIMQVHSQKQDINNQNYQKRFIHSQSVPKFIDFSGQNQHPLNQTLSHKSNKIHFAYQNPQAHFSKSQQNPTTPIITIKPIKEDHKIFPNAITEAINEQQDSITSIQNLNRLYRQYDRKELLNSIQMNKNSQQILPENKKIASKVDFGHNMLIRQVVSIREPEELSKQESYVIRDGNSKFKGRFLNPTMTVQGQKHLKQNMLTSWQQKNEKIEKET